MRKLIQILAGIKNKLPDLMPGEFGLCTDENLYIGNGEKNKKIAWDEDIPRTPSDIGASAKDHTHTAADIGAVPVSRKVNGKALSADISLAPSDIGAAKSSHTHVTGDIASGTLPITRGGTGLSTLTNSSYSSIQVRGISFASSKPSAVSDGCICLVYK